MRQLPTNNMHPHARWLLSAFYLLAGVAHLTWPAPFLTIIPEWVPSAPAVVWLTGIMEIAGAIGLCMPRLRKAAGVGLALYALCVFPANIKHALDFAAGASLAPGWWYHAPRLALQPLIIWWALWASGAIDWPFRRGA
jgi:uncharacterized membrane protein